MATAITNLRTVENNYEAALENASMDEILRKALAGNRAALAYCTGRPQIVLAFTATVATATDVLISDLTANFGVLAPPARGVRLIQCRLYQGDLTEGGAAFHTHGIKTVAGGTVAVSLAAAAREEVQEAASVLAGVKIDVSGTSLRLFTALTWSDDVYECVAEIYLPRGQGGVMSAV
jgi:hypothetical protein